MPRPDRHPLPFDGPINGERFLAPVEQSLLTTLRPGGILSSSSTTSAPPSTTFAALSSAMTGRRRGHGARRRAVAHGPATAFRGGCEGEGERARARAAGAMIMRLNSFRASCRPCARFGPRRAAGRGDEQPGAGITRSRAVSGAGRVRVWMTRSSGRRPLFWRRCATTGSTPLARSTGQSTANASLPPSNNTSSQPSDQAVSYRHPRQPRLRHPPRLRPSLAL